jgi:hypothetical protein
MGMTVTNTINASASPLGSTELDDKTGHKCKMPSNLYASFDSMFLGIDRNYWATACTERAIHNLLLQDIDALMYYYNTDNYVNSVPVSFPGNLTNMLRILARLTLLLTGTDACTPHIINSMWGED